jgi:hypothetical protein
MLNAVKHPVGKEKLFLIEGVVSAACKSFTGIDGMLHCVQHDALTTPERP